MIKNVISFLDWNSLLSAFVGGVLALLGAYLTMRGTKKERERKDARELVPLFYFLNSKAAMLVKIGNHPEAVPITQIVSEEEISDIRKRLAFASRTLSLSEIGDINSFCNQLIVLEETRKDCYQSSPEKYQKEINIYQTVLHECIQLLLNEDKKSGINIIGEKLEKYFSKRLK